MAALVPAIRVDPSAMSASGTQISTEINVVYAYSDVLPRVFDMALWYER